MSNAARKRSFQLDNTKINCKPFVKWVGGKSQLLPELLSRVPENYGRYFEPFLGGGALFFALQPEQAVLSDINQELIDAYLSVQSELNELTICLEQHLYDQDYFYKIRALDRTDDYQQWTRAQKAARLIYLNKTCFNGLYRVNANGHFNTPFGRYSNPLILDHENLIACSKVLESASIKKQSFDKVVEQVKKGDFVYFDPPYVPVSDTAYFTSYTSVGFGVSQQLMLRDVCLALDKKGVFFLLSNSATDFIFNEYKDFKIDIVQAGRSINSKGSKRGKVNEVIVRNF